MFEVSKELVDALHENREIMSLVSKNNKEYGVEEALRVCDFKTIYSMISNIMTQHLLECDDDDLGAQREVKNQFRPLQEMVEKENKRFQRHIDIPMDKKLPDEIRKDVASYLGSEEKATQVLEDDDPIEVLDVCKFERKFKADGGKAKEAYDGYQEIFDKIVAFAESVNQNQPE